VHLSMKAIKPRLSDYNIFVSCTCFKPYQERLDRDANVKILVGVQGFSFRNSKRLLKCQGKLFVVYVFTIGTKLGK